MLYGLYLSATGILANSYREDVISNNLANAETVGFKKDLASFVERRTAAAERHLGPGASDPMLENISGGLWTQPNRVDVTQGEIEPTGRPLDAAIEGKGFFLVQNAKGETTLTRDGRFTTDPSGNLIMAHADGQKVLDDQRQPITLDAKQNLQINSDGTITAGTKKIAKLGVFDVSNPEKLTKNGGGTLAYPDANQLTTDTTSRLESKAVERANVDPAVELVQLMDAQRQLEANANMIKFQDQAMSRLVNDVGKIS